jgi:hypothetical protein
MTAHIEQRVELTVPVAGQDDRILAHIGVKEIVGLGNQALVSDHQPGTPENFLHLVVINRLVTEDAAVKLADGGIDDGLSPKRTHIPQVLFDGASYRNRRKLFTRVWATGNPRLAIAQMALPPNLRMTARGNSGPTGLTGAYGSPAPEPVI